MPKLSTHVFRGETFSRVETQIPTSDVTLLMSAARQEVRRYTRDQEDLADEGFQPALIADTVESPTSTLSYGIAIIYNYDREAWAVELTDIPNFEGLDHRRRPRGGKGKLKGNQRLIALAQEHCVQFMRDCLDATATVLYRMMAAAARSSPVVAHFLADTSTMRFSPLQRNVLYISKLSPARTLPTGLVSNLFIPQGENRVCDRSDLMRHVRVWVNGQLQPAQTGSSLRSAAQDWDLALFGSL
jgi:hypothetical protein